MLRTIRAILEKFSAKLHLYRHAYLVFLKMKLIDCKSVLDLGCGHNSPLKHFSRKSFFSVGVDLFKPYLLKSKEARIHNDYIMADITRLELTSKSFDAVLALDVLEHLTKADGRNLIENIEEIGSKRVMLVTPNGFLYQRECDENVFQAHQSGWCVKDFRSMGYEVKGINGLKFLRKENAEIRFRPKALFLILSYISQILIYNLPNFAFQLFCVKAMNR